MQKAAIKHAVVAFPAMRPTALRFEDAVNLHLAGDVGAAANVYRAVLQRDPRHFGALRNLGLLRYQSNSYADAVKLLRKAVRRAPDSAETHRDLARALAGSGDILAAVSAYRQALKLTADAPTHCELAAIFHSLCRHDEAIAHYRQAIALKPDFAEAYNDLGVLLEGLQRSDEALAAFEHAVAINPRAAESRSNLGNILVNAGRRADAIAALEAAVSLEPQRGLYFHHLAKVKSFTVDTPQIATMAALAEDAGSLSVRDRIALHFALGKAYRDIGAYDRSFEHLTIGNRLKRRTLAYDEMATLADLDGIRAIFTPAFMEPLRGGGESSRLPVFIVGMPRSGSTLVSQILASHPNVFGAGEIPYFGQAVLSLASGVRSRGGIKPIYDMSRGPTAKMLSELGRRYLDMLSPLAPGAARITDKFLENASNIGLIHLALPGARIIHIRRNPLDTCLACFSELFADDNQPYSYDLGELARHYRAHERLMDHWQKTLPAGAILDVHYEDLVADLEGQTRRMLDVCGLAWDPACLRFYETKRWVRTASAMQVRQPLYSSSVGRSGLYGALLAPLADQLRTGK